MGYGGGGIVGAVLGNLIAPGIGGALGGFLGSAAGGGSLKQDLFSGVGGYVGGGFGEAASGGGEIFGPAMESGAMGTTGALGGAEIFGPAMESGAMGTTGSFASPMSWSEQATQLFDRAGTPGYNSYGAPSSWADSLPSLKTAAGIAQPIQSVYSGYEALRRAKQMQQLAMSAGASADPWGASGGRAQAEQQLMTLNSNPSAAMATDPRYAAMIQAAQRTTAMYGQDSGAMAVAGAQAGGNWYSQRMAELSGLVGANQNPAAAAQIQLQGAGMSNQLASQGLASVGYGTQRAFGTDMPPEVIAWMRSKGMM